LVAAFAAALSSCDAFARNRLARLAGAAEACSARDAACLSLPMMLVGTGLLAHAGFCVAVLSAHRGSWLHGRRVVLVVDAVDDDVEDVDVVL
jgi:hypothetical protein